MKYEHITDPIELVIAEALDEAGIEYYHEMERKGQRLDFYLPTYSVYIECKHSHSDRTCKQLGLHRNIILIQGIEAAKAFSFFIRSGLRLTNKTNYQ